jgi:hypothetical protein
VKLLAAPWLIDYLHDRQVTVLPELLEVEVRRRARLAAFVQPITEVREFRFETPTVKPHKK